MEDAPTQTTGRSQGILEELLRRARVNLVDTGTRNRLISFPKGSAKAKALEIIDELADEIFDILLRQEKKMSFLPGRAADAGKSEEEEEGIYLPPPDEDGNGDTAARHTDTKLQTKLTPEGLQKRLLGLFRDAKSLFEEQGVDVLFLAIGFLEWYEAPNSEIARYAPLVLLPVELVRDDARSAFKLQIREEDLSHNIALEERLRQDFGVIVPPVPDSEEWKPTDYLEAVRQAVGSQKRWRIEENMMALGFFSFTKIAMFRDLDPSNWPNGKLLEHPLIRALLADGFPAEEKLFPDDAGMDEVLHPADMIHVVDADSSQALVIEAIRRGRNLVVQGPPGTGKSQTITNIIATAVRDGKRVLFVAEKLAALNVVYSRLKRAGLSAICLELHSRSANKRAVLEELSGTLNTSPSSLTDAHVVERLLKARDQLNYFAALLNSPVGQTGVTPFEALGTQVYLAQEGLPPPEIDLPVAASWTAEQYKEVQRACHQYAGVIREAGLPDSHPWKGVGALALQPADLQRLATKLSAASRHCEQLQEAVAAVSGYLKWPRKPTLGDIRTICAGLRLLAGRPSDLSGTVEALLDCPDRNRLRECIETAQSFDREASALNEWFTDEAWQVDLKAIRETMAAKGHSFFGRLGGAYRGARDTFNSICRPPVPEDVDECIRRLDRLTAALNMYGRVAGEQQFLADCLGSLWRAEHTDYGLTSDMLSWIEVVHVNANWIPPSVLADTRAAASSYAVIATEIESVLAEVDRQVREIVGQLSVDLQHCFGGSHIDQVVPSQFAEKLAHWANGLPKYDGWVRLSHAAKTLRDLGGESVAQSLEAGLVPVDRIEADLAYCRAESIWKVALGAQPELAKVEGDARQALVEEFRQLDQQRQRYAQREVLAKHGAAMPRGSVGQMGIVRGEIARKRGHLPVRKLISKAGQVLQQIKPVMLMSPLSVAQFLPPGSTEFDLLVIDEASQVKPEDALGAVSRCQQIAVIGDKKQLPPTSFFDRLVNDDGRDDEDDEAVVVTGPADMESILALCEARGVPGRMLRWHYRSRHPSLIEVSNTEFYQDGLFLPPAPLFDRAQDGFIVRRVAGAYDRGGKRTNKVEADEVVRAIRLHARNTPDRSLGVVTFSIAQKQLIEDLLELERRSDPELDRFALRGGPEQLFVKNLENVQGDERDVIFVSVGYGPRSAGLGLDSMSFGPVSAEGGERRLNVLFTRARFRCEVFVSFMSGDIDISRTTQRGPAVLKRFLKYGETGSADLPHAIGGFDSPFEEAVANAVRSMGYEVDSQVGSAGFRIDLAVKHPEQPGRYICAIECDGANYHSSKSARERDRLRQTILEGLGWHFYRIWSTDWFRRPDREKDKVRTALQRAALAGRSTHAVNEKLPEVPSKHTGPLTGEKSSPEQDELIPPYKEASFSVRQGVEPHDISPREMAELAEKVIAIEGPIHEEEVARRISRLFGKERTGSRILDAVVKGLRMARQQTKISNEGKFWRTVDAKGPVQVRSRANASLTVRKADMLPPAEIKEAIRMAVQHNGPMTGDELVVAVSRVFGFDRAGQDLKSVIDKVAKAHAEELGLGALD
jgi:very-short-patch-repair endonuclease